MAKNDKPNGPAGTPAGKKPISSAEQAANLRKSLEASNPSIKKRKGKGLLESPESFVSGEDPVETPKKKASSKKSTGPSKRERDTAAKGRRDARMAHRAALQDIIHDYGLDEDDPQRWDKAEAIRVRNVVEGKRDEGKPLTEEEKVSLEIGDTSGMEVSSGLLGERGYSSAGDKEPEDIEPNQGDTLDKALGEAGARLSTAESAESIYKNEQYDDPNAPLRVVGEATRPSAPGVRISRRAELLLGTGAPRQPDEPDPESPWFGREYPKSREHAQQLLADALAEQEKWAGESGTNALTADPRLKRSAVKEGTESVAKANKDKAIDNRHRLYIAELEKAIKENKFDDPNTAGQGRNRPGYTFVSGVGYVPRHQLVGSEDPSRRADEGGLDRETRNLLVRGGSGAVMRRGEDSGVPRAVSGPMRLKDNVRLRVPAVDPTMVTDDYGNEVVTRKGSPERVIETSRAVADRMLAKRSDLEELPTTANEEKRARALELKTDEFGDVSLANPLEDVLPVTESGEPNPEYIVRTEGGVPLQDQSGAEANRQRRLLGEKLVTSTGKKTPLSLVYIKGEGKKFYGKKNRQVTIRRGTQPRADYKGTVQQETVGGFGPDDGQTAEYAQIRNELLGGQFRTGDRSPRPGTAARDTFNEANDIVESMIQIGEVERRTRNLQADASESSDTRPETAAGDIMREKPGDLTAIPVSKRVPVLLNPKKGATAQKTDTVVGSTSSIRSYRDALGERQRNLVSMRDVANMLGGPALTTQVPVTSTETTEEGETIEAPHTDLAGRVITTDRTQQPYDVVKRVNGNLVRVMDLNAEAAGKDPMANRARIARVWRRMNRPATNAPTPEPGTESAGYTFLKEHGMQPEFDPGFAEQVGTPEEVKKRAAEEKAKAEAPPKPPTKAALAAIAKGKKQTIINRAKRAADVEAAKPGLIKAASEADVEFELNGKRYNSAGDLVGEANPLGVNAPDSLDRGIPTTRMSPLRPSRGSTLPGIDTMGMPAAGTRTVIPRSGKNKGVAREVPDVTQGKTKGFQDRYLEAYRQSPRAKFVKEKANWDYRMEQESSDLDAILSGGVPKNVMKPAPKNWRELPAGSPELANVGRDTMPVPSKVAKIGGPIREAKLVYTKNARVNGVPAAPGSLVPEKEAERALDIDKYADKDSAIGGTLSDYRFEKYPELLARKLGPQFGG